MKKLMCFFKEIANTDVVKVFSLNAVATLIHMCTGLISTKVVASIIGPSGVALVGQLNNINSMLQGIAAGGIRSGVTKFIAEHKSNDNSVKKYISNALFISAIFTTIISLTCIIGHKFLSKKVLLSAEYSYVFIILGFTIFLFTLNSLLISILNGFKEFKKYVIVNISSSIFSLLFSVSLCSTWGLKGAMISAVTFQSVVLCVTIFQCRKADWFRLSNFIGCINNNVIKQYLQFTLMAFVSLSIVPVTQMIMRGYVISKISIVDAGLWEGMNRISGMYLSVITMSLSIYILPRLSEIQDKYLLKQELFKYYKFIIPLLIGCTIIIYLLRHFVIWVLYTPEFYPMERLFLFQLIGDLFKISSWLLSYIMIAKAMTKEYIVTEVLSGFSTLGLCYLFVNKYGIIGLNIGYMTNYIIYLLIMTYIFRDILFCNKSI